MILRVAGGSFWTPVSTVPGDATRPACAMNSRTASRSTVESTTRDAMRAGIVDANHTTPPASAT